MKKKQFWTRMSEKRPPIGVLCLYAWRRDDGSPSYSFGTRKLGVPEEMSGMEYWAEIPELDPQPAPPQKKLDFLRS